jgi:hypothetical protein
VPPAAHALLAVDHQLVSGSWRRWLGAWYCQQQGSIGICTPGCLAGNRAQSPGNTARLIM